MTLEKFNLFNNLNYLQIGGHGEKLKKIAKLGRSASSKGSINLYGANGMYKEQHPPPPPETFLRMLKETKINFLTGMWFTD